VFYKYKYNHYLQKINVAEVKFKNMLKKSIFIALMDKQLSYIKVHIYDTMTTIMNVNMIYF